MFILITTDRDTHDSSLGFDRGRRRRQRELSNNKNIKDNNHVRIYLQHIFSFNEYQEKSTYGLGHKLTLSRISDNAVLNKGKDINSAKIKISYIDRFVLHYTIVLNNLEY